MFYGFENGNLAILNLFNFRAIFGIVLILKMKFLKLRAQAG